MASAGFMTHDPATDSNDNDGEGALLLTVRFSASVPDLPLDVSNPETTTAAGLKQLIRARLPQDLSAHRLRLIYAGRALDDAAALTISLKLPPSPSPSAKGKEPVCERPRLYIHCSIGDIVLSDADLGAEVAISSTLQQRPASQGDHGIGTKETQAHQQPQSTTPAPRGFDRLISAGFTPAEVSALRSQFLAVQSVSRTPDDMPTSSELRDLEDRWMDEGSTAGGSGLGGGGGVSINDDDGTFGLGSRGAVDDMLWGAVMGFFWPVGCAMWLRREDGVWSWRKGLAVFVGVVVNVAFGAMRVLN